VRRRNGKASQFLLFIMILLFYAGDASDRDHEQEHEVEAISTRAVDPFP